MSIAMVHRVGRVVVDVLDEAWIVPGSEVVVDNDDSDVVDAVPEQAARATSAATTASNPINRTRPLRSMLTGSAWCPDRSLTARVERVQVN